MGRIFLLLLIALGAGLYFPQTRVQIIDYSRPLMNPVYGWLTDQELNQIVADLDLRQSSQGSLPYQRGSFEAWLDDRYPQEGSHYDAWGTMYRLQVMGNIYRVVSAGPDQEFGTDDDRFRDGERAPGTMLR